MRVLRPPSLPLLSQVPAVQDSWHNSPLRVAPNHSESAYRIENFQPSSCKQRKASTYAPKLVASQKHDRVKQRTPASPQPPHPITHHPAKTSRTDPLIPYPGTSCPLPSPPSRSQNLHPGLHHRCSHSQPDASIASLYACPTRRQASADSRSCH